MKKILGSWKLWTVLSAFIFVMTFSLVVYAATNLTTSSPYTSWKTSSTDKILDEDEWNTLMEKLQNQANNAIPAWAVVAFANTKTCPQWWSVYEPAINRYIRWWTTNYSYNLGTRPILSEWDPIKVPSVVDWPAENAYLKANNLPPHSHSIFLWWHWDDGWSDEEQPISVGFSKPWNRGIRQVTYWVTMDNYYGLEEDCRSDVDKCKGSHNGVSLSSSVTTTRMNGEGFSIMDPYVYLLYCIKN